MGPIEPTREAFWRMVLENKVVSVVMATGLEEGGKTKCSKCVLHSRQNSPVALLDCYLTSAIRLRLLLVLAKWNSLSP
jgi:protein tyrosine phosphatase